MLEIPESKVLANQINEALIGKRIENVVAWQNPHKFAFINGDPSLYGELLTGKSIESVRSFGSWVELKIDDAIFAVSEGTRLTYIEEKKKIPKKHQMLFEFDDDTYLVASVLMYGGLICSKVGEYNDGYYIVAQEKTDVLSDDFTRAYFESIAHDVNPDKISVKAFLATEQRIPGLGNGVLQDILYNAGIHPKRKLGQLSEEEVDELYNSIRKTLQEMYQSGGRDTDKDLYGNPGGYQTKMSKLTKDMPCEKCGAPIRKESYMGGSIYFCPTCQRL